MNLGTVVVGLEVVDRRLVNISHFLFAVNTDSSPRKKCLEVKWINIIHMASKDILDFYPLCLVPSSLLQAVLFYLSRWREYRRYMPPVVCLSSGRLKHHKITLGILGCGNHFNHTTPLRRLESTG